MKVKVKLKIILVIIFSMLITTGCEALSLNVSNGSVQELIRFAAREGNINVVMDSGIDTKVSVNIKDLSPKEVIQQLAAAGGLTVLTQGDILLVGRGKDLSVQLGQVHIMPIKYTDLVEMQRAVELYLQNRHAGDRKYVDARKKSSSPSGKDGTKNKKDTANDRNQSNTGKVLTEKNVPKVGVDINSRSLLVYGTQEEGAVVRQLVEKLDVPARQVSLEAKVVSMKKSLGEKIGVSWEWSKIPHNFTYDATLDLLISQGKARVLSKPNIVTMQGREAVINIGGEVPVPAVSVTNTTTTTSIDYRPAGIILKCRPFVNDKGYIESTLHIEVSSPSYVKEMKAYSFQKRSVDTQVRLQDGETLIIGGLISKDEEKHFTKVPFLGDIPILGKLFQSSSHLESEDEIMIFIKAKILP